MRFFLRISSFVFLFTVLIATLACGGGSPTTQKSSTIQPTITLAAQPGTVLSGTSTMLSWTASNATSVTISGLGTFPATGSVKVTPTATTTYTATATGPGGTTVSTTTVTVTASQNPPPTISFNAQPSTIPSGATSVLSWTTTNATGVSISGLGNFPANGSTNVTPTDHHHLHRNRARSGRHRAGIHHRNRTIDRHSHLRPRDPAHGGKSQLLQRDRQLIHALPEQPGPAVRPGHAVLRQHPPIHRKLF